MGEIADNSAVLRAFRPYIQALTGL